MRLCPFVAQSHKCLVSFQVKRTLLSELKNNTDGGFHGLAQSIIVHRRGWHVPERGRPQGRSSSCACPNSATRLVIAHLCAVRQALSGAQPSGLQKCRTCLPSEPRTSN